MFVYIHGLWELELSPEVEVFHHIQQEYLPLMQDRRSSEQVLLRALTNFLR